MKYLISYLTLFLLFSSCMTPKSMEINKVNVRDSIPFYLDPNTMYPIYSGIHTNKIYEAISKNSDTNPYYSLNRAEIIDSCHFSYPIAFKLSRVIYFFSPILPVNDKSIEFYNKMNSVVSNKGLLWFFHINFKRLHTKGKFKQKLKLYSETRNKRQRKFDNTRYKTYYYRPRNIMQRPRKRVHYSCCTDPLFINFFHGDYVSQICTKHMGVPKYIVSIQYKNHADTFYISNEMLKKDIEMRMLHRSKIYKVDTTIYQNIIRNLDAIMKE